MRGWTVRPVTSLWQRKAGEVAQINSRRWIDLFHLCNLFIFYSLPSFSSSTITPPSSFVHCSSMAPKAKSLHSCRRPSFIFSQVHSLSHRAVCRGFFLLNFSPAATNHPPPRILQVSESVLLVCRGMSRRFEVQVHGEAVLLPLVPLLCRTIVSRAWFWLCFVRLSRGDLLWRVRGRCVSIWSRRPRLNLYLRCCQ